MIYLEDESKFESLVSKGDVLVDFYATWCGPCKMVGEVLEELDEHFENVKIVKIDVDEFESIAKSYQEKCIYQIEVEDTFLKEIQALQDLTITAKVKQLIVKK